MKAYIGTKIVQAEPMNLRFFNMKTGKHAPAGYFLRDGYIVRYPDGYESWSPKEVFEQAYREVILEEKGLLA